MFVNLSQRIMEDLGRDIVLGRVAPATVLGEASIAAREGAAQGAGRGAVREAVKTLEAKGLIEARPRRGTTVLPVERWNLYDREVQSWMREAPPTRELLAELTQARLAFEPAAARAAAGRGDPAGLSAVNAAFARMLAASEAKDDGHAADLAFHTAILLASGNRFFAALAPLCETALLHSIRATNAASGDDVGDIEAHRRVRDAIVDGASDRAETAMRDLLRDVERALDLQIITP